MPVITFSAPAPGPSVAVGANLHGDECTGIGVVHALSGQLASVLLRGKVHLYPSLNPRGLDEGTRRMPGDTLDPNRAFPGAARGSAAERHAWRIWSDLTARRPDLYIDLHTDAGGAMPYAIVDRVVRGRGGRGLARRCVELATASGLTVLREYPADRYRRFELDRSLPGALVNELAIPSVTLEVGPRRRIDPTAVKLATRGVLGIMSKMQMVGTSAPRHETVRDDRIWRRESGPRTTRTGVLIPMVQPADEYRRGAALAQVRGLAGELREVLRAPCDGFVVSLPDRTSVGIGVACATLAVPDESAGP
jgi:predicted deacylase